MLAGTVRSEKKPSLINLSITLLESRHESLTMLLLAPILIDWQATESSDAISPRRRRRRRGFLAERWPRRQLV